MTDTSPIPPLTAGEIAKKVGWPSASQPGFVVAHPDDIAKAIEHYAAEKDRRIADLESEVSESDQIAYIAIRRADAAEARIAELEREREGLYRTQASMQDDSDAAEALSAAAVERERGMREALEQIAHPHGQVTDLTAALELLVMVQFVARAALSSPAPGNGEADQSTIGRSPDGSGSCPSGGAAQGVSVHSHCDPYRDGDLND